MARRAALLALLLLPACAPPPAPLASTPPVAAGPAEDRPAATPEQLAAMRQRFRDNFFARYDTNRDATVTRAEYDAVRAADFARTDTDRDGRLTEAEYVEEYRTRLAAEYAGKPEDEAFARQVAQASRRFESIDRDRDLIISRAEYEAIANRTFTRSDVNGDGRVTAADYDAASRLAP